MSRNTFLFPHVTSGMVTRDGTAAACPPHFHAAELGFPPSDGERTGFSAVDYDYRLPAGIVSLEHWLDLNA